MGGNDQINDGKKPWPWWRRWNAKRFNGLLVVLLAAIVIGGLVFAVIPYVASVFKLISGGTIN